MDSPQTYNEVVTFSNNAFDELLTNRFARRFNAEAATVADLIRPSLDHRGWRFEDINDRILMGDATTKYFRDQLGLE